MRLALTDHGNLHGALEFYKQAKKAGINPILGYEAYIAPDSRFKRDAGSLKEASYHLTLLAKNRTGFQNLIKLASAAFLEGFYHKPRIDKELLAAHSEGLICLSGCVSGEFSRDAAERLGAGSVAFRRSASKSPPGFTSSSATAISSKSRTTAWKFSGWRMEGAGRSRPANGDPAGGHQRRPLRESRGCRSPGCAALHQHGQIPHRHEPDADGGQSVLSSAARRKCTPRFPGWKKRSSRARRLPTASISSWNSASGISRCFDPPEQKTPSEYLRELCLAGLEGALRRQARAAGR